MIMVHGRNARAESILELARHLDQPGFCYLAPAAANNTWYPYSFLAPIAQNEPGICSGIATIHRLVQSVVAAGVPTSRVCLLGFSQGACLASTYAVRHADRFGGVFARRIDRSAGPGSTELDGTRCSWGSDIDPHIEERVEEARRRRPPDGRSCHRPAYPGMGHTVNEDELNSWLVDAAATDG
jgi:phospholipase/carboxylesterase